MMGTTPVPVPGYPLPANEAERLEEILAYDFSDGGTRAGLDQICLVAQSLFAVPMALVTLVGRDEQTFLAQCGADARSTPRKDAFCNWTILSDEVLVVTDASRDQRFRHNPLVTGPFNIRFYAGAPLTLRPGIRLGALCLVGTEPRTFSADEASRLQMLATVVVNELRRRRTMIDLKRKQDLLSQTARMTQVGSWELNVKTGRLTWSEQMYRIFEVEPAVAPTPELMRSFWVDDARAVIHQAMNDLLRHRKLIDLHGQIVTAKDRQRWIRCIAEAEVVDGAVARINGSVQDVTAEREHAEQIETLAFRDALTGLPNRALFQKRLAAALEDARLTGSAVGLVMLDLDHFKDVNDTLGHETGDALLQVVAEQLLGIFGDCDVVARLGGDEFAIVLTDVTGPEDLTRLTGLLMQALRNPVQQDGISLSIDVSVGTALYPQDALDATELLKNVDIALYRAKDAGRNRVAAFVPEMRCEVEQRMSLLRDVRAGIGAGEFTLYYQPLVAIGPSRRVTGFEALMRWQHSAEGVLPPARFLAAFEDRGLSLALGSLALDTAIAQMRAWLDRGIEFGRVAVNLSTSQFRTGSLADTIKAKLQQWDVPARRLGIEVTENVYMGWGSEAVADTLRALHEAGVLISLDDFGTGYASLTNLKQFPIDKLKIDKSFVQRRQDSDIVKAVITLGTSLGMEIVAEGVESVTQLRDLEAMGCHQAQGYYFARPMPAEEVARFLETFYASQAGTIDVA